MKSLVKKASKVQASDKSRVLLKHDLMFTSAH